MEKLTFEGSLGEELSARMDKPDGEIKSYALFAHCFTCGKDIFAASRISKALNDQGIAVMRFDFTGLGASDGDFANTNFSSNVGDLVKAADTMRAEFEAPSLIIGHSFGGAAVLRAAHDIDEVKAVVTIAAPADIAHIKHHFDEHEEEIIETGEAEVLLANRPFKIKKQFLDDIKENNTKEHIADLKRALLVMHSPTDDLVGIENAAMIYDAAKHPKSFVSLYEADHLLRGKEHVDYAAKIIAAWAGRYIAEDIEKNSSHATDGNTAVIVKSTGNGPYQNVIEVDGHRYISDLPKKKGGISSGASPYGFLMASLGACKSMTMRMYANRKEWPLESVELSLSHTKTDAPEGTSVNKNEIDKFSCAITIKGKKLNDEQRKRLIEIADKCPVHQTITHDIIIETKEK